MLDLVRSARRRAIVVAHPDDETLWCGGLPIVCPGDWTIIACSIPRIDPIRAWKFFDACAVLGATGRIIPVTEDRPLAFEMIDLAPFDLIVTHGAAGEYGHEQHRAVHRFVTETRRGNVLAIGWRAGGGGGAHEISLMPQETARKRTALKRYNHISRADGRPKWEALLDRYPVDLSVETYDLA